jgi:hypothetical protein
MTTPRTSTGDRRIGRLDPAEKSGGALVIDGWAAMCIRAVLICQIEAHLDEIAPEIA